ncbi:hypothetical protein JT06_10385 [Desulfobulbus sp. Tol-SR]|jgi:CRISPR-associated protein Csm5|nr:hypothetical protein JT06_10385 [Desulfobulbus sp. Tol-SR]
MNFLETCNISITTLSPIHIGCGEDYEPTNYVVDGNRLYTFDPVLLLRELPQKNQEEFARIVEGENSLRTIQSFFYRNKHAATKIGIINADVVQPIQTFYDSRIGQVAQREQGGKNVLNKLEIARTAFNPINGKPILPGSSVKGAVRTAVLESLRQRQGFKKSREMETDILQGSFSTDPFRLLKISDGRFLPKIKLKQHDGSHKEVERLPRVCLQVNRKKHPNRYGAGGNVNTLLECIPVNTPHAFTAKLVVEHKTGDGRQTPVLQLDFATVARACNHFYLERFHAENGFLKENKYAVKWASDMEKALGPGGLLKNALDEGKGFLLRVGRHSGAESVTVNAPRSIKIMKGRGKSPEYAEEATTLWLAADSKDQVENLQPFGWVFVRRIS